MPKRFIIGSLVVIFIFSSLSFFTTKLADAGEPLSSSPPPPPKRIINIDELSGIVNQKIEELNRLLEEKGLGRADFKMPRKGQRPLKGGGINIELKDRITQIDLDLPEKETEKVLRENIESSMKMIFRDIDKSNLSLEEKAALKQQIRKIFQESEYPLRRLSEIRCGQIRWPRGERGGFLRPPPFSSKEVAQLSKGQKIMKVIKVGGAIIGVAVLTYEGGRFIYNVYTFEGSFPKKIFYATDKLTEIPFTPELGITETLLKGPIGLYKDGIMRTIKRIDELEQCLKTYDSQGQSYCIYRSPFSKSIVVFIDSDKNAEQVKKDLEDYQRNLERQLKKLEKMGR